MHSLEAFCTRNADRLSLSSLTDSLPVVRLLLLPWLVVLPLASAHGGVGDLLPVEFNETRAIPCDALPMGAAPTIRVRSIDPRLEVEIVENVICNARIGDAQAKVDGDALLLSARISFDEPPTRCLCSRRLHFKLAGWPRSARLIRFVQDDQGAVEVSMPDGGQRASGGGTMTPMARPGSDLK